MQENCKSTQFHNTEKPLMSVLHHHAPCFHLCRKAVYIFVAVPWLFTIFFLKLELIIRTHGNGIPALFIFNHLNFSPMVTTEVAQLSKECNAWRETLRSYRDEFGKLKQQLLKIAAHQSLKEDLLQIEHLDNQLHIQLINIHDLKQAIKNHDRKIQLELQSKNGTVSDESLADHENLHEEYQSLEHTLQDIKEEFNLFAART
jgi:hypothetical protein